MSSSSSSSAISWYAVSKQPTGKPSGKSSSGLSNSHMLGASLQLVSVIQIQHKEQQLMLLLLAR
jgi:hypothetical protein